MADEPEHHRVVWVRLAPEQRVPLQPMQVALQVSMSLGSRSDLAPQPEPLPQAVLGWKEVSGSPEVRRLQALRARPVTKRREPEESVHRCSLEQHRYSVPVPSSSEELGQFR
jgi:hypothetical protein